MILSSEVRLDKEQLILFCTWVGCFSSSALLNQKCTTTTKYDWRPLHWNERTLHCRTRDSSYIIHQNMCLDFLMFLSSFFFPECTLQHREIGRQHLFGGERDFRWIKPLMFVFVPKAARGFSTTENQLMSQGSLYWPTPCLMRSRWLKTSIHLLISAVHSAQHILVWIYKAEELQENCETFILIFVQLHKCTYKVILQLQ